MGDSRKSSGYGVISPGFSGSAVALRDGLVAEGWAIFPSTSTPRVIVVGQRRDPALNETAQGCEAVVPLISPPKSPHCGARTS